MWFRELKYYRTNNKVPDIMFATHGAACFDICAFLDPLDPVKVYDSSNQSSFRKPESSNGGITIDILPGERMLVPTGYIFDIPGRHSLRLHVRSSVALKKGLVLANGEGIIDSDYVDPVFMMMYNYSTNTVTIASGERLCQVELFEKLGYDMIEIDYAPDLKGNRTGGFGSTGQ